MGDPLTPDNHREIEVWKWTGVTFASVALTLQFFIIIPIISTAI